MPEIYYSPTITNPNKSPQVIQTNTGQYVSTLFTFGSPTVQTQANSIFMAQSNYEATTGKKYQFKSDQDRIAALIGRFRLAPNS
jgi:hypothetical protein